MLLFNFPLFAAALLQRLFYSTIIISMVSRFQRQITSTLILFNYIVCTAEHSEGWFHKQKRTLFSQYPDVASLNFAASFKKIWMIHPWYVAPMIRCIPCRYVTKYPHFWDGQFIPILNIDNTLWTFHPFLKKNNY
jgi:hypothetical protein